MPDLPAAFRRPLPPWAAAVAAVVLTLLTWHVESLVAQAGVDPSWRVGLYLAQLQDVSFGPDFVWTYGPVGFLAFPLALGSGVLAASVAFVLVTQAGLAYVLVRRAGAAFGGVLAVVAAYAVLMLPILAADFVALIVGALALWALAEPGGAAYRLLPVAGGVLAGVAMLTKTNMGLVAVAAVLVAAVAGGVRRLGVAAIAVAVTFGVLWLALGNALADIPGWWRLSVSLVSGYSAAMQLEQPGLGGDYRFAAVLAGLLAVATWAAARRLPGRYAAATALVVAGYAFATFKESFVRHDALHAPAFFAAVAVVVLALGTGSRGRAVTVLALVVAVLAVHRTGELSADPWLSAGHALAHMRDAIDPGRSGDLVERSRRDQRRSLDVPAAALRELRGRTVHVDPWEVSAVSAYRLRWRPLPVPQTYSAYTSALDEQNASFLATAKAPERILREDPPEHVNGRDRSIEAPATYRAILCGYRQVLATRRWQVLARAPRCGRPRLLGIAPAAARRPIAVPEAGPNELVIARIEFGDSAWNRLRGLVYKPHDAVVSLGGGGFTPVAADVVRDGIVVHVPGNLGYDPRFGGAIDWRSIAAGGLNGSITITFQAIPVRGAGPPPTGERAPHVLPHILLQGAAGRERIRLPDGRELPVAKGGGFVDYGFVRRGSLVLQGWAADAAAGIPASRIVVFADGRLVFAGPPNVQRPDVAAALGRPALRRAGYRVLVPAAGVRDGDARRDVRIFSLVGDRALEVEYPLSYGWRRR